MTVLKPAAENFSARPEVERIVLPLSEQMAGGSVNVFYLPGHLPTLIDAGLRCEGALDALESGLNSFGAKLSDIRRLVITHAHIDHMGLADAVFKSSGAELCANPAAFRALGDFESVWSERRELHRKAAIAGGVPSDILQEFELVFEARRSLGPRSPIPESAFRPLDEKTRLRCGDSLWSVLNLPGHAPDHIALLHKASGSAISGDLLLRQAGTIPLLEGRDPSGQRPTTLADLIASWRRFGRLPVDIAHTGHGPSVRAHRVLIARRLATLRSRLVETRRTLLAGASTIWDVACTLDEEAPTAKNLHVRLGETVALLDWLVDRGRAERQLSSGVLAYAPLMPGQHDRPKT